ncbi:protein transporter Sec31 [Streptomyces sp. NPDC048018]|uniref:protein transporter Sec31 n=1 Tax=Streptomyces sp. NPDC048018 TaxID=3365499 RepID=UPI0037244317
MRTRTERRERLVPHTVDGQTELVPEPYDIEVPIPPRDWDHIVLIAALGIVGAGLLIVVVWSTASIGELLVRTDVAAVVAYGAATGFSLGWIVCMALEWLARYDPVRVRRPRKAGHVFLAADMAAVCVHGWVADSLKVGIIGAVLSGGAKALWTLLLDHQAAPLDPRTQQWVNIRRGKIGGRLALAASLRQLGRVEKQALALEGALRSMPDASPDEQPNPADGPDAAVLPMARTPLTTKDAVRTAWDSGLRDEDQIRRAASGALGKAISPDTVSRYVRALKVGA